MLSRAVAAKRVEFLEFKIQTIQYCKLPINGLDQANTRCTFFFYQNGVPHTIVTQVYSRIGHIVNVKFFARLINDVFNLYDCKNQLLLFFDRRIIIFNDIINNV